MPPAQRGPTASMNRWVFGSWKPGCRSLSRCLELKHDPLGDKDAIPIFEGQPIYPIARVDQSVQTFGVLNYPDAVVPAHPGVEARDALGRDGNIVVVQAANRHDRLVQRLLFDNLAIHLDQYLGILCRHSRWPGGGRFWRGE